jgi:hypothetical protein
MIDRQAIRQRWEADGSKRDERGRRLFAASEARAAGWGGLQAVSTITGLARSTIERGLKDLDGPPLAPGQVRREGGGPRPLIEIDATLLDDLRRLVEPATLGDPVRPLLWVSKSLDKLAAALTAMGHSISPNAVRKLLTEIGFSAGQPQGRRGLGPPRSQCPVRIHQCGSPGGSDGWPARHFRGYEEEGAGRQLS